MDYPVHDIEASRRDLPLYQHLRDVFAECVAPQVKKMTFIPPLRRRFSGLVTSGVISTWVSQMLIAHQSNGEIKPEDIAGRNILALIKSDLRQFPQIDFPVLMRAALARFEEQADGLPLPHGLHLQQQQIAEARQLIP